MNGGKLYMDPSHRRMIIWG